MIDVNHYLNLFEKKLEFRGKKYFTIKMAKSHLKNVLNNFKNLENINELTPIMVNNYLFDKCKTIITYKQYRTNCNSFFEYVLYKPSSFKDLPKIPSNKLSKKVNKKSNFIHSIKIIGYDVNGGRVLTKKISHKNIYVFGYYFKFVYKRQKVVDAIPFFYVKLTDTSHIININFYNYEYIKNLCENMKSVTLVNSTLIKKKTIEGDVMTFETKDFIVREKNKDKFPTIFHLKNRN